MGEHRSEGIASGSTTLALVVYELRSPGRARALLAAVALGCLLVVASAILGATMSARVGTGAEVAYENTDLVVRSEQGSALDVDSARSGGSAMSESDLDTMRGLPGVAAAAAEVRARAALWSGGEVRSTVLESLPVGGGGDEGFAWQRLDDGRFPSDGAEIALSRDSLRATGARVGDVVTLGTESAGQADFTVVGAFDTRGALGYQSSVYGIVTPAVAQAFAGIDGYNEIRLRLDAGTDPAAVTNEINTTIPVGWPQKTSEIVSATQSLYGTGLGVLTSLIYAFALVAALIALVVLSTVVWASLPGRLRELSLMRLVGATRGQLMTVVAAETGLVALAGGLLAVPLGIGLAYVAVPLVGRLPGVPSVGWDAVVVPWLPLVLVPIGAVLGGLAAAVIPVRTVGRVSPAAVLRADAAPAAPRATRTALVLGVVALALVALVVAAARGALGATAAAGVVLAVAWVAATPTLCRFFAWIAGEIVRDRHPVAELTAGEIRAFPGRAAATGLGALLAAVVIAVSWVTLSSVSATAAARSTQTAGPEIMVGAYAGAAPLSDDVVRALEDTPGVDSALPIEGARITTTGPAAKDSAVAGAGGASETRTVGTVTALDAAGLAEATDGRFPVDELDPGVLYLPSSDIPPFEDGGTAHLEGPAGAADLEVRYVDGLPFQALVAPAAMERLSSDVTTTAVWLRIAPDATRTDVLESVRATATVAGELPISGSAVDDARIDQVVGLAKGLATGMLAVAVLIAVIGAAVTTRATLRERAGEFAVLRLLGMEARQLRRSVAGETWTVGAIGVVAGLALGTVLGAAAALAVARALDIDPHIAVPWIPLAVLGLGTVLGLRLAATTPIDRVSFVPPARALRDADTGGAQ